MDKYRIRYTNALGGGAKDCTVSAYDTENAIEKFLSTRQGKTAACKILVVTKL